MLSSDTMSWHIQQQQQQQQQHHTAHHPLPPPLAIDPPSSSYPPVSHTPHTPHHPGDNWDIFASPVGVDFDSSASSSTGTTATTAVTLPSTTTAPSTTPMTREPSYDLFNTQSSAFAPTTRFRSDSAASSAYNPAPVASPTSPVAPYEYMTSYPPQPPSHSPTATRPSSGSFSSYQQQHDPSAFVGDDAYGAAAGPYASYPQQPPARPYYDQQQPHADYRPQIQHHHSFSNGFDPTQVKREQGQEYASNGYYVDGQSLHHQHHPQHHQPHTAHPGHPVYAGVGGEMQSFIRPYVERYVNAPNRSAAGECSVIVMSSKVAQKSYGSEKRFLCPPPTAVFIGTNWWHRPNLPPGHPLPSVPVPPKAVISISGEPSPLESLTEWSTPAGKAFDPQDPPRGGPGVTTYMGRCVGKQLFITDYDDRKKKVEALVRVTVRDDMATSLTEEGEKEGEREIGVFASRPIKVISKPSKKRQSAKNLELCINHGSTVSLFHRLRSQTVSTKYLCVSGSAAAYKGSDGQLLPGVDRSRQTAPPSFIAKTACWDSFVIYIVDVNHIVDPNAEPCPPPHPDYPSPPPNAIPYNSNGAHMYTPIYYNQTVVLQCLISGVVSPVLIVRRVDHTTVVVGGGAKQGQNGTSSMYCPPGEVCGDPVSQLHKIALEVFEPTKQGMPVMDPSSPGSSGSFLSCMGERVNTYRPSEDRQWNGGALPQMDGSSSGSTRSPSPTMMTSPTAPDYFAHHPHGVHSALSTPATPDFPSNDGGRVARPSRIQKRGSVNGTVPKVSTTKNGRRRVQSASASRASSGGDGGQQSVASSGALWNVDIGETAVWTVVGTDQIRYDFYVPPPPAENGTEALAGSPADLLQPITPSPSVIKYLPPDVRSAQPNNAKQQQSKHSEAGRGMITVYGENFSKNDPVSVWFGSEPSPMTEVRCAEVVGCLPPSGSSPMLDQHSYQRPIVLVRADGVVYPSKVLYP